MADDKTKTGKQDRSRVSGDQGYEVRYFAKKHGMSVGQGADLLEKRGWEGLSERVMAASYSASRSFRTAAI
jgi:hypothetical protein